MNRYKNDELINIATAKLRSQKSTITYLKARVKNLVTKNKIK